MIEKEKKVVTEETILPESLHIWVKDLETLNLYESFEVFEDPRKILKLNKWIKARKYNVLEHVTDDKITLKVKIFPFLLYLNSCHPQKDWKPDGGESAA
jgi:hypothetical protein